MKAAVRNIYRTTGDTDRITVILSVLDEGVTAPVEDDADTNLHVNSDPVIVIQGTAKGDGSGTFYFDGEDLAELSAGSYAYEVEVDDGNYEYTPLRGAMVFTAQIA